MAECGGFDGSKNFAHCYKYQLRTHTWAVSGAMSEAKRHHASSLHSDLGLIITGGYTTRSIRTVETTRDGKHFSRELPPLPVGLHAHSQVIVDSNVIMVFGGCTTPRCHVNVALKLDIAQKKWKRLPNMPVGRYTPGCGVARENGVPKRVIVAGGNVGGKPPNHITDRVDILELSTLTWTKGRLSKFIFNLSS